uniref:NAD(P)/FAD-dependent oxidoreductase n=3 Tax=Enterocloster clostridioformis TaxID=1531 RepID=UPI00080C72F6|nr:FAD-dependent oxidoreductase [Enterocloster clostridioformis]
MERTSGRELTRSMKEQAEVFVIGGGFAAVEEGIFLTKYAKKVTLIVREDDFSCARTVAEQVEREPRIQVRFNTEIVEAGGETMVSYARFRNNRTGEEWIHEAGEDGGFGIFVFAGYVPNTAWMPGKAACDKQGYIITDSGQKTNVDGVYGAGDVCIKNLRQVVTAVGDGAVAATSLEKYVSSVHEKLQIPEFKRKQEVIYGGSGKEGGDGEHGKESFSQDRVKDSLLRDSEGNAFLSDEIRRQLSGLFSGFEKRVIIRAALDDSPLSGEMSGFLGELEGLTDRISCIREHLGPDERERRQAAGQLLPAFRLEREDGSGGNILYHVP